MPRWRCGGARCSESADSKRWSNTSPTTTRSAGSSGLPASLSELAPTIPLTTVPEDTFAALFRHELRWARTIRALAPGPFAASCLQYPIFWGLLALILAPAWGWVPALLAWLVRFAAARGIDRAIAPLTSSPPPHFKGWLLPLRELMSVAVMIASYAGLRVDWRGHTMIADGPASPKERA